MPVLALIIRTIFKEKTMIRVFVVGMLFVSLFVPYAHAQAQQKLTARDCAQVFPWANSCRESQMHQDRLYAQAWHEGHEYGEEEFLGFVSLSTLDLEGNPVHLLVGVEPNGSISKVIVKETDAIDTEFLAQFEGKNLKANFEIVCTPEDLMFVPRKIKAMRGKQEMSESIAKEVKGILGIADDLFKTLPKTVLW
jgi:hypothetical protein